VILPRLATGAGSFAEALAAYLLGAQSDLTKNNYWRLNC